MQVNLKIYEAGRPLEVKEYNFFPGPPQPRTIHLDISKYIQRAIALAIGEPDSLTEPKKELDTNGSPP